jgi:hypothetical protein
VLGGADIVDGSPVLDIKPYVAFCDSVAAATAPSWVAAKVRAECARRRGVAGCCLHLPLPALPRCRLSKHCHCRVERTIRSQFIAGFQRVVLMILPPRSAFLLQAEDEPLHIGALLTSPSAEAALRRCWQQRGARSLYTSFEQYRQLLEQVG